MFNAAGTSVYISPKFVINEPEREPDVIAGYAFLDDPLTNTDNEPVTPNEPVIFAEPV